MRGVYVAGIGRGTGRLLVELGLMELLSQRVERPGVYRTITAARDGIPDRSLELLQNRYPLAFTGVGATVGEIDPEGTDDVLIRLAAECEAAAGECDGLVVLGPPSCLPPAFDARLAAKLGMPVVVVTGGGRAEEIVATVRESHRLFAETGCSVLAIVVNRVSGRPRLDGLPLPCFVIPELPTLAAPTVRQVAAALHATRIQGDEEAMQREVLRFASGGATLPVFLDHLRDDSLVVMPGDRADLLVAALAAEAAGVVRLAGVLLTLGHKPSAQVRAIMAALAPRVPVLASGADTFALATRLEGIEGYLAPEDHRRIETALGHFGAHVNTRVLTGHLGPARTARITSRMFTHTLMERAAAARRHIVLAEGEDERVLRAADLVRKRDIAHLTLLGRPEVIRRLAHGMGLDLDEVRICDPVVSPLRETFAETYALVREHRGMTRRRARDVLGDANVFGTMMVYTGIAHGMVSGVAHSTAATILPALQVIKTEPGATAVSSAVFASLSDRVVIFADCGLHPCPDPLRLADIAVCSARTARRFGIEPKIAMLSYSSGPVGAGGDVDRVGKAAEIVRTRAPEFPAEGPIRYDVAVAGGATVFVFPDLEIADGACQAVRNVSGAAVYGPVLQGLRHPVNAVSRTASVEEIVTMVAITAVQAQDMSL